MGKNNPKVFIEVTIGNRTGGRVYFELSKDICPKTVENFLSLLQGSMGYGNHTTKKMHYKGTKFFQIEQGVKICGGDIEGKNGEGGESIYGRTFRDENYVRRHTQAGVLSMWTPKGRHTNASSFMITLKTNRSFDGRYVSFGQVIGGMEIIRAIEKVPVTGDLKPRVDITIVDCGVQIDEESIPAALAPEDRIAAKYGRKRPMEMRDSTKADSILTGETITEKADREQKEREAAGIVSEEVMLLGETPGKEKAGGAISSNAAPPEEPQFKSDVERRIYELRLKMNKGRQANNRAVLDEKKRNLDPDFDKKKASKEWKERQEAKVALEEAAAVPGSVTTVPKGKDYLCDTAENLSKRIKKQEAKAQKKTEGGVFGWDVFNQDSLLRSHEKQIAKGEFQLDVYRNQKEQQGESFYTGHLEGPASAHKPSQEAKDRVAAWLQGAEERKAQFSRRRTHYEEEDVTGINEQNKHFNKKIHRSFKQETDEIKQNLERGTAL